MANNGAQNENLKAKMREAREKKQAKHHPTDEGADHDGSDKSHGADKPIEQAEFRRKSI